MTRSKVAIDMGREDLVVNKKYNEIAKKKLPESELEEQIFAEMKKNGVVHGGAKKAFDHYVEQFWEENAKTIYGLS